MGKPYWDFRCQATKLPDGRFQVKVVGEVTDETRERVGINPLWELIRLLGSNEKTKTTQTDRHRKGGTWGRDPHAET